MKIFKCFATYGTSRYTRNFELDNHMILAIMNAEVNMKLHFSDIFSRISSESKNVDTYSIPNEHFALFGIYYSEKDKRFLRMPLETAKKTNSGVVCNCKDTAGGRLRFATDSKSFCIHVKRSECGGHGNMSRAGRDSFVLLEEFASSEPRMIKCFIFSDTKMLKYNMSCNLADDGKMHNYILYFPNYTDTTSLKISLEKGAKISNGIKYRNTKPIVYYGSSITQGGAAGRADNSYEAIISKWNNIDFINLGFSGSAKAEPAMVEYLASLDAELFVMDYDHNAPNAEYLSKTHYNMYAKFRELKRDLPIILISKPDIDSDLKEGETRRKIVRGTYERALAAGDKNIYYIDGKDLFGTKDRERCTVDTCHPNDLGFYRMASVIYAKMCEIDVKFK